MLKIATHDSATGEKGKGFLSWLVTPFAKTQSKYIQQQYDAGCRNFDLRIKKVKDVWHCAHGPWRSKRTFSEIARQIAAFPDRCHVCVTYEGPAECNEEIMELYENYRKGLKHIIWGPLAVKYGDGSSATKVKYSTLIEGQPGYAGGEQGFLALDGRSWHTYLPIPWLWNLIYTRKHEFNEDKYIYVDFL